MKNNAFAAKAVVISAVFAFASGATASTVDSLEQPAFLPASSTTDDSAATTDTETTGFQTTLSIILDETVTETAPVEPVAEFFEAPKLEPFTGGIAYERGHLDYDAFGQGGSELLQARSLVNERGFGAPASLTAPATATATMPAPAATTVAAAVVPLPASGVLLCLGLFGLSRCARRAA